MGVGIKDPGRGCRRGEVWGMRRTRVHDGSVAADDGPPAELLPGPRGDHLR